MQEIVYLYMSVCVYGLMCEEVCECMYKEHVDIRVVYGRELCDMCVMSTCVYVCDRMHNMSMSTYINVCTALCIDLIQLSYSKKKQHCFNSYQIVEYILMFLFVFHYYLLNH